METEQVINYINIGQTKQRKKKNKSKNKNKNKVKNKNHQKQEEKVYEADESKDNIEGILEKFKTFGVDEEDEKAETKTDINSQDDINESDIAEFEKQIGDIDSSQEQEGKPSKKGKIEKIVPNIDPGWIDWLRYMLDGIEKGEDFKSRD